MTKLEVLNSLEIKEWDIDGTELIYVLTKATEENINTLLEAEFTMAQIEAIMDPERKAMDISVLAFECTEANVWSAASGFENGFAETLERTCSICGCTDYEACPGGCCWVEENLCSSCAEANDRVAHELGKEVKKR